MLSAVPFVSLLLLGYYLAGVWSDLFSLGQIYFSPFAAASSVCAFYAASYIRRKMESLASYADKLSKDGSKTTLGGLYSLRWTLVTFLLLLVIVQPIYIYSVVPSSYSLLQGILASLPYIYWDFAIGTVLWVFGYGMVAIFRMGRLPLKLKSFSEDRMLGLRPFGVTSLRLIGSYFLILTVIFAPQALFGLLKPYVLGMIFGLILLGIVMFFLPLLRYRSMLLLAKH